MLNLLAYFSQAHRKRLKKSIIVFTNKLKIDMADFLNVILDYFKYFKFTYLEFNYSFAQKNYIFLNKINFLRYLLKFP